VQVGAPFIFALNLKFPLDAVAESVLAGDRLEDVGVEEVLEQVGGHLSAVVVFQVGVAVDEGSSARAEGGSAFVIFGVEHGAVEFGSREGRFMHLVALLGLEGLDEVHQFHNKDLYLSKPIADSEYSKSIFLFQVLKQTVFEGCVAPLQLEDQEGDQHAEQDDPHSHNQSIDVQTVLEKLRNCVLLAPFRCSDHRS
jgi:hypothetical protein